jgi:transcriptional regulator of acetoin/glycerol metabolism
MARDSATADTMLAWERFLIGHPRGVVPACNFVVSSWQRSLALGVDPTSFSAPLLARGEALHELRRRHSEVLAAAADVFAELTDLFAGSRSIMLLTDPDGVVLEAAGDLYTLEQGQDIHLMQGGHWNEAVVGTNGIGTALATGRPAQVHAAEHFCEGIKRWTCAAAPIYDPASGAILGVLDISGPPATYQRNNLALAVATARQIEASIAAHAARDRACLLEACLQRLSASDAGGLIAIDRNGRLVHNTGRVVAPVSVGEHVPGLNATLGVEEWANRLPEPWRAEWFRPVAFQGRPIGAVLVVPEKSRPRLSEPERSGFDAIIGTSPAMEAVIARARRLAPRRVPVLIEGETGVGKELFARALHGAGRFVAFNCGAASRELLAGELFGHVRGAFTGATSEGRAGRFELAHGGTLCLDEIGELPLDLQPMLLRVLEEGVVYRLGDSQPRSFDVRLITMTNRNLRDEVEQGRFRRDLFHRIAVTSLAVPPLRERGEDVDRLTDHFNVILSQRHHVPPLIFTPEIRRALRGMPWPGNVRELRNFVENLLLSGADPVVTFNDMPRLDASAPLPAKTTTLDDAELQAISHALQQCGGSITAAARLLEISRSTLYRKMERYHLHHV